MISIQRLSSSLDQQGPVIPQLGEGPARPSSGTEIIYLGMILSFNTLGFGEERETSAKRNETNITSRRKVNECLFVNEK